MKFAVVLLLAASPLFAADQASVPPELKVCASIKRNPERLACFDRVMAALAAGKNASATLPVAAEQSFGVIANKEPAPQVEDAQRGDLESVSANIKSFGRDAQGSLVIHLDNGQSWRQIDDKDSLLKKGDAVTVRRAALGSFQMVVPSGRSFKVRRVS